MPILGIYASSMQPSLATAFDSIATQTVGAGGAASVTFSSIPSTYKHLQIRCIARSTGAETTEGGSLMIYASPHANNAYFHSVYGSGTSANALNSGGASYSTQVSFITKSGSTANNFGVAVIDILDYANTNKNKTYRSLGGWDDNGSGYIGLFSGMNYDTSTITSLTLSMNSGSNLAQYSTFALYGIKG